MMSSDVVYITLIKRMMGTLKRWPLSGDAVCMLQYSLMLSSATSTALLMLQRWHS